MMRTLQSAHHRMARGRADAQAARNRAEITGESVAATTRYDLGRQPDADHWARLAAEAYVEDVNARIWPAAPDLPEPEPIPYTATRARRPRAAAVAAPRPPSPLAGHGIAPAERPRARRARHTPLVHIGVPTPARGAGPLDCPRGCGRTFRTDNGRTWHVEHWPTCTAVA